MKALLRALSRRRSCELWRATLLMPVSTDQQGPYLNAFWCHQKAFKGTKFQSQSPPRQPFVTLTSVKNDIRCAMGNGYPPNLNFANIIPLAIAGRDDNPVNISLCHIFTSFRQVTMARPLFRPAAPFKRSFLFRNQQDIANCERGTTVL